MAVLNGKTFFDKIPTTQFYTVTYDMKTPFNVFGAVQDEGTMSGNETNVFGKEADTTLRPWRMAPAAYACHGFHGRGVERARQRMGNRHP